MFYQSFQFEVEIRLKLFKYLSLLDGLASERKILFIVVQHFDPLDLFESVIVIGKLLMQKLWLCTIGWGIDNIFY